MKQLPVIAIALILIIPIQGCFKEDLPVPRHTRGNVRTDTIAMTPTYSVQVYYDLDSSGVVRTNEKKSSDLGFDCSDEGWIIRLNTADFMVAADMGEIQFGSSVDTSGRTWRFDSSDRNPDSTAIGRWFSMNAWSDTVSNRHVYVINRGMDESGNSLGFIQLIIDSLKYGTYYFRFAPLTGSPVMFASVNKDPAVNFLWYSFTGNGSLQPLEPEKHTWDLLFTQYTTLLYTDLGEPYPYLVTGVLINRNNTMVSPDSTGSFDSISYEEAIGMSYSTHQDAIGFDWKYYNFEAGSYTVKPDLFYVIRNRKGDYYKLRFVGFYNNLGQKGYPSIEFQICP